MNRSILILVMCGGLLGGFSQAADMGSAAINKPTKWLTREQQQALTDTVPARRAPGSEADKADLAAILQAQGSRTDAMKAEAKRDEKFSFMLFQPVYGPGVTPEKDPSFYAMMKNVLNITWNVNESAKNKYKRLRPYKGHPDQVHALFDVNGYSYPSGHAMGAYTLAVVLGAVIPDKVQAFLDRAGQIAQSRVDAGVHYPSDIAEGETLGKATGAAILASADFQKDLAAVQAELKK